MSDVSGTNDDYYWGPEADAALTGQVRVTPVSGNEGSGNDAGPPPCPEHRETQHRDGQPKWCNRCGWTHGRPATPARKIGRANGGWGT